MNFPILPKNKAFSGEIIPVARFSLEKYWRRRRLRTLTGG
jgi:hypothetical protein